MTFVQGVGIDQKGMLYVKWNYIGWSENRLDRAACFLHSLMGVMFSTLVAPTSFLHLQVKQGSTQEKNMEGQQCT